MTKYPEKKHEYKNAFEEMHMYEIKDRAVVLRDLGYDKKAVKVRIQQDVEWEFEGFELPDYYEHIDNIVEYVFKG